MSVLYDTKLIYYIFPTFNQIIYFKIYLVLNLLIVLAFWTGLILKQDKYSSDQEGLTNGLW